MSDVRVEGARELRRALRRAGISLDDLKAANARAASIVARTAAARAPRRTGRLAASITGNNAASRAVVSAPRVPYAAVVHWGHAARGIRPNPFISAAAQDTERVWLPEYEKAVGQIIDSLGGTYP